MNTVIIISIICITIIVIPLVIWLIVRNVPKPLPEQTEQVNKPVVPVTIPARTEQETKLYVAPYQEATTENQTAQLSGSLLDKLNGYWKITEEALGIVRYKKLNNNEILTVKPDVNVLGDNETSGKTDGVTVVNDNTIKFSDGTTFKFIDDNTIIVNNNDAIKFTKIKTTISYPNLIGIWSGTIPLDPPVNSTFQIVNDRVMKMQQNSQAGMQTVYMPIISSNNTINIDIPNMGGMGSYKLIDNKLVTSGPGPNNIPITVSYTKK